MFVSGKLFQPSIMFVGKAMGLPESGAPERCFIWVGPGLARKHWTRLEKLGTYKHSSLLQKTINYSCNKFYSTDPRCSGLDCLWLFCRNVNDGVEKVYEIGCRVSLAVSSQCRRQWQVRLLRPVITSPCPVREMTAPLRIPVQIIYKSQISIL